MKGHLSFSYQFHFLSLLGALVGRLVGWLVGWGDFLGAVLQQAFILVVDNVSSIVHAAVAHLDGVAVK